MGQCIWGCILRPIYVFTVFIEWNLLCKANPKQIQRFVYFFIRPRLTFDDENFAFVTFISYETFLREKIPKIEKKKIMSKVRKKSSN